MITQHSAYLEKLSVVLMNVGRSAPRYQDMALLYPRSKPLQDHLNEYFIIVVRLCHHVARFAKKSALAQMSSSLIDADVVIAFQTEGDRRAAAIREVVSLLTTQTIEDEARGNMPEIICSIPLRG